MTATKVLKTDNEWKELIFPLYSIDGLSLGYYLSKKINSYLSNSELIPIKEDLRFSKSMENLENSKQKVYHDIISLGKVEWYPWYCLFQDEKPPNCNPDLFGRSSYVLFTNDSFYATKERINFFELLLTRRISLSYNWVPFPFRYVKCCPYCEYMTHDGKNKYNPKDFLQCHHYFVHDSDEKHTEWLDELFPFGEDLRNVNLIREDDLNIINEGDNIHGYFPLLDENIHYGQPEPRITLAQLNSF